MLLPLLITLSFLSLCSHAELRMRHDYKLTFKKPYLYSDNHTMPFYEHYGSALVGTESVRLAPSIPGLKGSVWSRHPNKHEEWMVNLVVHVQGRGHVGGDGLAFWFTKQRGIPSELIEKPNPASLDPMGQLLGPLYGSSDQFDGFGLIFDSYDEKTGNRNQPIIYGVLNDGSYHLSALDDPTSKQIGQCFMNYRNTPVPVHVRIMYGGKTLAVSVDTEKSGSAFQRCFEIKDVKLPRDYYFGVSSSTGHLADDHDVVSLDVYELNPTSTKTKPNDAHLSSETKHQYEEWDKKFEDAREAHDKEVFNTHETKDEAQESGALLKLRENMFHVIEKLDLLHQRLEGGSSTGSSKSTSLDSTSLENKLLLLTDKIGNVQQDLQALSAVVRDIGQFMADEGSSAAIKDKQRLVQELKALSQRLHSMESNGFNQVGQGPGVVPQQHSLWTYALLFLVCQIGVMSVSSVLKGRGRKEDKKFI